MDDRKLMKNKHPDFKTIFLICLAILSFARSEYTTAQERVNIIRADQGGAIVIDNQPVRTLTGNVIISTSDMVMEADSVYQFTEQDRLQAFNVQIETENEMIWADTIYHDTQRDFSELRGRVVIESEQNTLFSEAIDVLHPLDLALFNVPVRFEDEEGVLTASSGFYNQYTDNAFFRGDVQLTDSTQYLEADSLYMNRSQQFYELHSRVYADDFEEKATLAGRYLRADSSGYRLLTGDAWLMQLNEEETDTTHLLAEKIELQETDTVSYMDAFDNVRIWSPRFSAVSDTAHYRDDIEQFILTSSPKLWQKNIQLTGPTIEAYSEDDEIRFLSSYPRPIAVQEDTVTGRLHQMAGDTLHAYFEDGVVDRIVVFDNSEIIFHQRDEDDEPDGLIELAAVGSSTLFFLDGDFDFFRAEQNIDGSYLPEDPANIERTLNNFSWDPDLKPGRPALRTPRLPPIPEERAFELPPRYVRYLEAENNEEIENSDNEI